MVQTVPFGVVSHVKGDGGPQGSPPLLRHSHRAQVTSPLSPVLLCHQVNPRPRFNLVLLLPEPGLRKSQHSCSLEALDTPRKRPPLRWSLYSSFPLCTD